ncbi:hypothetical protein GCM10010472_64970 [Pseudonocardia halophobica]|uniref:Uncharacterized protein n=1 Tax=Pseudonocardia halophobica TaxID=29401 RepID=A0A9W6UED2_9PSEU|nr:hypothetical protein GCM10017577_70440 [Pseudonocardia halophobica]
MARRQRGEIEVRPNGSLRVRVYAGIDPLSDKRNYLVETVPAGKDAQREPRRCSADSLRRSTSSATRARRPRSTNS